MNRKDGGQKKMRFAKPMPNWDALITTSGYGWRKDPATGKLAWHGGIDKSRWDIRGKPVKLSRDARIRIRSDYYGEVHADSARGKERVTHVYAHMMMIPSDVKKGVTLKRGTVIGFVNNKGYSTGDHLHFGLVDALTSKTLNPDLHWIKKKRDESPIQKNYYIVRKGGWRSQVIGEIIKAGIWKGTWRKHLRKFNKLNPITPRGGWRRGNKVKFKPLFTRPKPQPKPDSKRYYTIKKGGWRSHVIEEIIKAGIWKGRWQDYSVKFEILNPFTPRGGWKKGDKVRWK